MLKKNFMNRKIRRAKIHGLYRPGVVRWYTKQDSGKYVPWLNVNGLWLEQAGFMIGDRIQIDVSNNRLIIKKLAADGDH
jgi:toxic protein SymE